MSVPELPPYHCHGSNVNLGKQGPTSPITAITAKQHRLVATGSQQGRGPQEMLTRPTNGLKPREAAVRSSEAFLPVSSSRFEFGYTGVLFQRYPIDLDLQTRLISRYNAEFDAVHVPIVLAKAP